MMILYYYLDEKYESTYDGVPLAWHLGKRVVDFDSNSVNIVVDNCVFNETPGWYELAFNNNPTQQTMIIVDNKQ